MKIKQLTIEWQHFERKGQTCSRCHTTGQNIRNLVEVLKKDLKSKGVEVIFKEVKLFSNRINDSNKILINGKPIEKILNGLKISKNDCLSCSCLLQKDTQCRTATYKGKTYEDIPKEIIHEAALKVVDADE